MPGDAERRGGGAGPAWGEGGAGAAAFHYHRSGQGYARPCCNVTRVDFSPLLLGLTGSAAELRKVADEFKVSFVVHREEGERAGYTLDHSSVIYLIGPDGRFVAPIPADASDVEMAEFIGRSVELGRPGLCPGPVTPEACFA
ncbi:MAG: SCO family protein [Rhodospirillales bacterium]